MWSEILWGQKSKLVYLLIASALMLFTMLGSHEIWTQEHRWADIVYGMFYRHDFLHPYLNDVNYYDKPLLSYWLIAAFSLLTGEYSTWAMRLPSALAGMLAIGSIYWLGTNLKDKRMGLLAGWMLLTTYYFVFWARTSSADMLNLGGIIFAVAWYFAKKDRPGFWSYSVFFMILAVTSLCKGLVGAVVPVLVILPHLLMNGEWKKHVRVSFVLATIPAMIVYLLPFWASTYFGGTQYEQSGLYLVYRENIMRYFQPFDHKGPIYTYFIFLPVYLLPWTLFFIPALFAIKSQWKNMSVNAKWMIWAVLLLFVFFTVSGSRRNYYVLPLVPFAILMTADWILKSAKSNLWAGRVAILFFAALFLNFDVAQPLYYSFGGQRAFAEKLHVEATKLRACSEWNIVMLDPESKTRFYLHLSPEVKNYAIHGGRNDQTEESLRQAWPVLNEKQNNMIFVSREMYEPILKNMLQNYDVVHTPPSLGERVLGIKNMNAPVAFIPRQ